MEKNECPCSNYFCILTLYRSWCKFCCVRISCGFARVPAYPLLPPLLFLFDSLHVLDLHKSSSNERRNPSTPESATTAIYAILCIFLLVSGRKREKILARIATSHSIAKPSPASPKLFWLETKQLCNSLHSPRARLDLREELNQFYKLFSPTSSE
jgi:hypothetical protein